MPHARGLFMRCENPLAASGWPDQADPSADADLLQGPPGVVMSTPSVSHNRERQHRRNLRQWRGASEALGLLQEVPQEAALLLLSRARLIGPPACPEPPSMCVRGVLAGHDQLQAQQI